MFYVLIYMWSIKCESMFNIHSIWLLWDVFLWTLKSCKAVWHINIHKHNSYNMLWESFLSVLRNKPWQVMKVWNHHQGFISYFWPDHWTWSCLIYSNSPWYRNMTQNIHFKTILQLIHSHYHSTGLIYQSEKHSSSSPSDEMFIPHIIIIIIIIMIKCVEACVRFVISATEH